VGSKTTLYIARHGETTMNADHITMGQLDSPLTKKGLAQVERLRDELLGVDFDAVYSSDLTRCVRTATIVLGSKSLPITETKAMRERYFGPLEGKPAELYAQLRRSKDKEYQALSKAKRWQYKYAPELESDGDVYRRVIEAVYEIIRDNQGKTVLIVTHSGPARLLLIGLGYFTETQLPGGSFKNGQYCILEHHDGAFKFAGIFPESPDTERLTTE